MGRTKRVSRIVFFFVIDIIKDNATDVIVFKNLVATRRAADRPDTAAHAAACSSTYSTTGYCSSINKSLGSTLAFFLNGSWTRESVLAATSNYGPNAN